MRKINHMTTVVDITPLLDDLLWLAAVARDRGLEEAMEATLADYTANPNLYSDGSIVWESTDHPECYSAQSLAILHLPPHRRHADVTCHVWGFPFLSTTPAYSPRRPLMPEQAIENSIVASEANGSAS